MAGPTRSPGSRRSGGPGQAGRQRTRAPRQGPRPRAAGPPTGRGPEGPSEGDQSQRLRASLTGRAAVLALVLGLLAVSYAYPLRAWYDQHTERAALKEEAERLRESVAELEGELRRWDDPAYVRAQARERLGYVMPGEIGYTVVQDPPEPQPEIGADGLPLDAEGPWYSRLWASVEVADEPASAEDGE